MRLRARHFDPWYVEKLQRFAHEQVTNKSTSAFVDDWSNLVDNPSVVVNNFRVIANTFRVFNSNSCVPINIVGGEG